MGETQGTTSAGQAKIARRLAAGLLVLGVGTGLSAAAGVGHARTAALRSVGAGIGQLPGGQGCSSSDKVTGCPEVHPLANPGSIAVSPDGTQVFVAGGVSYSPSLRGGEGFGALSTFRRDRSTGAISLESCISSDRSDGRPGTHGSCSYAPGLTGASAVAVAHDGGFVFVAASAASAVTAFKRDSSGALHFAGCIQELRPYGGSCARSRALQGADSLALSPDDNQLYIGAGSPRSAITTLDVSQTTHPGATGSSGPSGPSGPTGATGPGGGALLPGEVPESCVSADGADGACTSGGAMRGLSALAMSADGKSLYATAPDDGAVDTFARDSSTGALSETGCLIANPPKSACAQAATLTSPTALAVSPDGQDVYVGMGNNADGATALTILRRDSSNGALSQVKCLTGQPDNANSSDNSNASSSRLHPASSRRPRARRAQSSQCEPVPGLFGANAVAVASDGRSVYVASGEGLVTFSRNPSSGGLTEVSCIAASDSLCDKGRGLNNQTALAASPDGRNVYVSVNPQNAVNNPTGSLLSFGPAAAVASAATLRRDGTLAIELSCPRAIRRCAGQLRLLTVPFSAPTRHQRGSRARLAAAPPPGARLLAAKPFTLAGGRHGLAVLRVRRGLRQRIARSRGLRLRVALAPRHGAGGLANRVVLVKRR